MRLFTLRSSQIVEWCGNCLRTQVYFTEYLYVFHCEIVIGSVITGYRIRDGKWTLIGKGDPQRPQVGYIWATFCKSEISDHQPSQKQQNQNQKWKLDRYGNPCSCMTHFQFWFEALRWNDFYSCSFIILLR